MWLVMVHLPLLHLAIALPSTLGYRWPNPQLDEAEKNYVEQSPTFFVSPCSSPGLSGTDSGRQEAAEWLRTAYHDMATHDATTGLGGLDASLGYELDRPENVGSAFNETLGFFFPTVNSRISLADLLALGAISVVKSCANIDIPFRVGRIDAHEAGRAGVPQPFESLESHTQSFAKQGFNSTEMIALVACGHTIGGVHGLDFPDIVPNLNNPDNTENVVHFDTSFDVFDNRIATDFVNNVTQNPLAFGANETTRSDARIFDSDGGAVLRRFAANNELFLQTCKDLIGRMIDTVPKSVVLSEPITPLTVKPTDILFNFTSNGSLVLNAGIRLLEGQEIDSSKKVTLRYKTRSGNDCQSCEAFASLTGNNLDNLNVANFSSWTVNAAFPPSQGISSFVIDITDASGKTTTADNEGTGFPIQDLAFIDQERTCFNSTFVDSTFTFPDQVVSIQVSAFVRADINASSVNSIFQVPDPASNPALIVTPRFLNQTLALDRIGAQSDTGYDLYQAVGMLRYNAKYSFMSSYDLVAVSSDGTMFTDSFHIVETTPRCVLDGP